MSFWGRRRARASAEAAALQRRRKAAMATARATCPPKRAARRRKRRRIWPGGRSRSFASLRRTARRARMTRQGARPALRSGRQGA